MFNVIGPYIILTSISLFVLLCIYIYINTIYKKQILNRCLIAACKKEEFFSVLFLIQIGADFDLIVNKYGDSVLHILARYQQFELYEVLVSLGANEEVKNKSQQTARQMKENSLLGKNNIMLN